MAGDILISQTGHSISQRGPCWLWTEIILGCVGSSFIAGYLASLALPYAAPTLKVLLHSTPKYISSGL